MDSRKHAREEARVEEEKKFTDKLEEAKTSHKKNLEELKEKNRLEIEKMEAKIKSLEQDVEASQSVAKTLNENIANLQKQLKRHQRTEKYLKEKLTGKSIDIDEELWKTPLKSMDMEDDLEDLTDQITHLKEEIEKLLLEKEILNKSLESVVETTEWEKRKLERKIEEQRRTIESLRAGARKAEEEKTKLQDELEKKEEKERGLVNTIGELETQLKSHHAEVEEAVGRTKRQKEKLEQQCESLQKSNTKMTDQLKSVSTFLGEMRDEHDGIVEKAALHEKEIELVAVEHEKILKYVEEQQQKDFEAQRQRYLIAKLLKAQEDEMARNMNARQRIKDAIANQSKRSSRIATQRKELLENSKKIGVKVEDKLKGVLCAIPQNTPQFGEDDSSGQSLLYSPSSTDASLNERRNDFEHRQYSGSDSSRIGIDPPDEVPVRTRKPIRLSLWNESSPYIEIH
jgi:chromosome segregation ATPase